MSSGGGEEGREGSEKLPEGDRGTCTPCRGSGRLTSALGGETHEVTCPWCGGSGRFEPGRDAQEHPAEQAEGATATDDPASTGDPASDDAPPE